MRTVIAGNIREKALLEKTKHTDTFIGKAVAREYEDHDELVEAREERRRQNMDRRVDKKKKDNKK